MSETSNKPIIKQTYKRKNKEVEQEKGLQTGKRKRCSILVTIPENKNRVGFPAQHNHADERVCLQEHTALGSGQGLSKGRCACLFGTLTSSLRAHTHFP